jgi:hypothetical protein
VQAAGGTGPIEAVGSASECNQPGFSIEVPASKERFKICRGTRKLLISSTAAHIRLNILGQRRLLGRWQRRAEQKLIYHQSQFAGVLGTAVRVKREEGGKQRSPSPKPAPAPAPAPAYRLGDGLKWQPGQTHATTNCARKRDRAKRRGKPVGFTVHKPVLRGRQ